MTHRLVLLAAVSTLACGNETGPCDTVFRSTNFATTLEPVPPAVALLGEAGMTMEDYGKRLARRPAVIRWYMIDPDSIPSGLHAAIDTVETGSPTIPLPPFLTVTQLDSLAATALIEPLFAGRGWFYILDQANVIVSKGAIRKVSGGDVTSVCVE